MTEEFYLDHSDIFGRFTGLTDEEIVSLYKDDEYATEYIIYKYKGLVRTMARRYYLIGGDCDDLIQEGMIGLYKAIRDFAADKKVPFFTFAELCITRQMITAIKAANRLKHRPLNGSVSINRPAFEEDGDKTLEEVLSAVQVMSPEDIYIENERFNDIENKLKTVLSSFENKVVELYLEGKTYVEISSILGKSKKSIDNALQRAKNKLINVGLEDD